MIVRPSDIRFIFYLPILGGYRDGANVATQRLLLAFE